VYHEGWGQWIFQSGNEMAQNFVIRNRMVEMQSEVPAEKEWWEKRRASIQSEFMKELDQEKSKTANGAKIPPKSSDDEVVLVEAGGPTAGAPQQGGGKKKKKGKN
jgi:translocation protein SEC66